MKHELRTRPVLYALRNYRTYWYRKNVYTRAGDSKPLHEIVYTSPFTLYVQCT
jgi:hypothetical protein